MGIDLCPVERMTDIGARHGEVFTERVFTEGERAHAGKSKRTTDERLAARWAAKEAAIKALGAPEGLKWHDMEVVNADDGAPGLILTGKAKETADAMGVANIHITISHAGGMAVAVVVLEGEAHDL